MNNIFPVVYEHCKNVKIHLKICRTFAGQGQQNTGTFQLKDMFFNMDVMRRPGIFAQMIKGQTLQPVEQADGHFSSAVSLLLIAVVRNSNGSPV